jgi:hypothetical protein
MQQHFFKNSDNVFLTPQDFNNGLLLKKAIVLQAPNGLTGNGVSCLCQGKTDCNSSLLLTRLLLTSPMSFGE